MLGEDTGVEILQSEVPQENVALEISSGPPKEGPQSPPLFEVAYRTTGKPGILKINRQDAMSGKLFKREAHALLSCAEEGVNEFYKIIYEQYGEGSPQTFGCRRMRIFLSGLIEDISQIKINEGQSEKAMMQQYLSILEQAGGLNMDFAIKMAG